MIDLPATLTDLCGVKAPEPLHGQSLVPMLKDSSATGRGWALTQVMRGGGRNPRDQRFLGYTLRTARWRYTEWDEGKQGRELYDHDADPNEITNLADDPAKAATVDELAAKLREAVTTTYPADGKIPELRTNMWAPNLTNP